MPSDSAEIFSPRSTLVPAAGRDVSTSIQPCPSCARLRALFLKRVILVIKVHTDTCLSRITFAIGRDEHKSLGLCRSGQGSGAAGGNRVYLTLANAYSHGIQPTQLGTDFLREW
jgi:hypothetical protein